ncbi:hypothetical protein D3C73_1368510 [compost metagenome]
MQKSYRLNNEEKDLRKKIDEYVLNAKQLNIQITFRNIYIFLGRSRDYIYKHYPGLFNYLTNAVNSHRSILKDSELQRKNLEIKYAVEDTYTRYGELNLSLVAKHMGIKFVHSYPLIKKKINSEINAFSEGK